MSVRLKLKLVTCVATALLLNACGAANTMYDWGGYNGSLLSYYKNPDEIKVFDEKLLTAIEKSEIENKTPPGLYAEYGYLKLEQQDAKTAIVYFNKEREKWPESKFLMTKVIDRLTKVEISSKEQAASEKTTTGGTE